MGEGVEKGDDRGAKTEKAQRDEKRKKSSTVKQERKTTKWS